MFNRRHGERDVANTEIRASVPRHFLMMCCIRALVPLRFRSSWQRLPLRFTNFGSGHLRLGPGGLVLKVGHFPVVWATWTGCVAREVCLGPSTVVGLAE